MLGVFAPFSCGHKDLQACGGHPVGEEIDFSGFVCSRLIGTCIVFFIVISFYFILIILLVY